MAILQQIATAWKALAVCLCSIEPESFRANPYKPNTTYTLLFMLGGITYNNHGVTYNNHDIIQKLCMHKVILAVTVLCPKNYMSQGTVYI